MNWDNNYKINIEVIDDQHKGMLDLISRITGDYNAEEQRRRIADTVRELVSYTARHFADEQKLMNQIDYPDYQSHVRLHKEFIIHVKGILIRLRKGKNVDLAEIRQFLEKWWIDHIVIEDSRFGKYYNSKSIIADS